MFVIRILLLVSVLSGLIHIFAILAVPYFASDKIWQNLTAELEPRTLAPLPDVRAVAHLLGHADPAMAHAVCHFSVADRSVTLSAEVPTDFWQVTLYDTSGHVIYTLHDGASKSDQLMLKIKSASSLINEQKRIEQDNQPIPAAEIADKKTPIPLSRPLSDSEFTSEIKRLDKIDEDSPETLTVLDTDRAFAVIKIFKASHHFAPQVNKILATIKCL